MGFTMSEKIMAMASANDGINVHADDIIWVRISKAMMDDVLGPRLEIDDILTDLNASIWDKDRVVIISDHYTPPANVNQADIVKFTRDWANTHQVDHYYEFAGPCHQVMVEKGHVLPGEIIVGTDSHTCTYGALAALGTGVGSTEMAGVLATGITWMKVPRTIKAQWHGDLNAMVMAKDISLKTISVLGHAGATYKTIEYCGETIDSLIMDERLCLSNMAVEAGAKAGLIRYDAITAAYLEKFGVTETFEHINPDEDANYETVLSFDAQELVPQVACPHEVDNVKAVSDVSHVAIHQAYIGSCTGGRYNDLLAAATLLEGKTIAKGIRLLVSPASKEVYDRCLKEGILTILADAGATILASSCGACLGIHSGTLASGEVCISTTNRNFLGRMGSKSSEVYLASPLTVAASAVTGYITDPNAISGGIND
ncbi:3-isopropylmalate dehydratase large subunit [Fusibacter paucivorans]|uniref:3-isopropylmalate dehydratase large subunit n=1 Tax=Fusibacter paucivorans TaxID=76009 RepID=A0ABS5PSX7_9FIRM|nr:3-isopropylmalate dehydratase large subunit [Fusibacter paucivorans]MBS7528198.1 3-isopropylmalate dehydratase large subunit [Fusibacter paucivorans]